MKPDSKNSPGAEPLSTLETATFFQERKAKAGQEAFRRILDRPGGEPPRESDELPE